MALIALLIFAQLSLSEDEAVKVALLKSPLILAEKENLKETKGGIWETTSGFLPKLSLNANYSYNSFVEEITQPVITGFIIDTTKWIGIPVVDSVELQFGSPETRRLNFSVTQPIFDWFKSYHSLQSAKRAHEARKIEFEGKKIYLENEVRKTYTEALLSKKQIEVLRQNRSNLELHYKVVQERFNQGYASELEVLKAEVALKNIEPQIERAKIGHQKNIEYLKNITGIEEEVQLTDSLTFVPFKLEKDTLSPEEVIDERKDYQSLLMSKLALKEAYHITEGIDKPNLFANFQFVYGKPRGFFGDEWGGYWTFTLGINWTLFEGLKYFGTRMKAKARLNSFEKNLHFLKKRFISEISLLKSALTSAFTALISQESTLELARKALSIAEEQYKTGLISQLEYMDTQLTAMNAELNYYRALKDYKIAKLNLLNALKGAINIQNAGGRQ